MVFSTPGFDGLRCDFGGLEGWKTDVICTGASLGLGGTGENMRPQSWGKGETAALLRVREVS